MPSSTTTRRTSIRRFNGGSAGIRGSTCITSASWLNLVEVWFSHLTTEQVRRGDFLSVPDLIDAIYAYIHNHNQHAVPFIWTAPPSDECGRRLL